jgi:hypothetical protein
MHPIWRLLVVNLILRWQTTFITRRTNAQPRIPPNQRRCGPYGKLTCRPLGHSSGWRPVLALISPTPHLYSLSLSRTPLDYITRRCSVYCCTFQTTQDRPHVHPLPRGQAWRCGLYADASWDEKFSVSGDLVYFDGCLIVWYSRK